MKASDKNNSFKTPPSYFEEFSQNLKIRLSEEELRLPKESGFKVPDTYFDTISTSISSKLDVNDTKVVRLKPNKMYYMAAASVAAAVLIFFGINWNNTQEASWETIADTDIENYFDANGLGLTSYEIAEVIPVDDLEIIDFLEIELHEDYIIDYLSENTNDFEELNLDENE
jgi:hypothetical protein